MLRVVAFQEETHIHTFTSLATLAAPHCRQPKTHHSWQQPWGSAACGGGVFARRGIEGVLVGTADSAGYFVFTQGVLRKTQGADCIVLHCVD